MMRARLALFLSLIAASAAAQLPPVDATKRPACVDGRPWSIWLLNESSSSDCDAVAGGSSEAFCCCKDGTVAACASGSGGSGTVTSVALAVPAEWSVSGSPVTSSGTITISEATQSANTVYSGPTSGSAAAPGFRALVAADLTAASPYGQYDAARPPSSCAKCEEYTGDAESGSLTWTAAGNADVTKSFASDAIRFVVTGDSTAIDRYMYTTAAPASGDWTLTAKATVSFTSSGVPMCGLAVIHSGTQASPTSLTQIIAYYSTSVTNAVMQSATSLTSATSNLGSSVSYASCPSCSREIWFQFRYSDSADTLQGCISDDGLFPGAMPTAMCPIRTSVTAATYFGFLVDDLVNVGSGVVAGDCTFDFIRLRTDSAGTTAPFKAGE